MVGNLWEWTDEWYAGLSAGTDGRSDWPSDYGGDGTWNITQSVYNSPSTMRNSALPAAALRGGGWFNGTLAGRFALLLVTGPSGRGNDIGFRCVIPR
jgi:formylglycine-generating enzyme required for sulfatase activity